MLIITELDKITGLRIYLMTLVFFCISYSSNTLSAKTETINPNDLNEFSSLPTAKQDFISYALYLAGKNYKYKFGGDSVSEGGFDCSGAVFHCLREGEIRAVPRTAAGQYLWLKKESKFLAYSEKKKNALANLKPGDLLFWEGTYDVKRNPPISHVMIYLGTLKKNGKRVMVGSSSGRRFEGRKKNGFSVFDFKIPKKYVNGKLNKSIFVGYGSVPNIDSYKTPYLLKLTSSNYLRSRTYQARNNSYRNFTPINNYRPYQNTRNVNYWDNVPAKWRR